jgi:hypothetical protein
MANSALITSGTITCSTSTCTKHNMDVLVLQVIVPLAVRSGRVRDNRMVL